MNIFCSCTSDGGGGVHKYKLGNTRSIYCLYVVCAYRIKILQSVLFRHNLLFLTPCILCIQFLVYNLLTFLFKPGAYSGICPGGGSAPVGAWKPPEINRFYWFNILSIFQSFNLPIFQHSNLPTFQNFNLSTIQPYNLAAFQPFNLPIVQPSYR